MVHTNTVGMRVYTHTHTYIYTNRNKGVCTQITNPFYSNYTPTHAHAHAHIQIKLQKRYMNKQVHTKKYTYIHMQTVHEYSLTKNG